MCAAPATGKSLGTTIKYLRRTTSGAAGNGLGATIKYLRGAAVIRLRTTTKYLRRAMRQRPGTTIKYVRCTKSGAAGNGISRYRELLIYAGRWSPWTPEKGR
jgi:hypothetical protein